MQVPTPLDSSPSASASPTSAASASLSASPTASATPVLPSASPSVVNYPWPFTTLTCHSVMFGPSWDPSVSVDGVKFQNPVNVTVWWGYRIMLFDEGGLLEDQAFPVWDSSQTVVSARAQAILSYVNAIPNNTVTLVAVADAAGECPSPPIEPECFVW